MVEVRNPSCGAGSPGGDWASGAVGSERIPRPAGSYWTDAASDTEGHLCYRTCSVARTSWKRCTWCCPGYPMIAEDRTGAGALGHQGRVQYCGRGAKVESPPVPRDLPPGPLEMPCLAGHNHAIPEQLIGFSGEEMPRELLREAPQASPNVESPGFYKKLPDNHGQALRFLAWGGQDALLHPEHEALCREGRPARRLTRFHWSDEILAPHVLEKGYNFILSSCKDIYLDVSM